ncbi:hypothetical protein QAD02_018078, partial [Eretmocerus hayati]
SDANIENFEGVVEIAVNVELADQLKDEPLVVDFEAVKEDPLNYQNPASTISRIDNFASRSHCSTLHMDKFETAHKTHGYTSDYGEPKLPHTNSVKLEDLNRRTITQSNNEYSIVCGKVLKQNYEVKTHLEPRTDESSLMGDFGGKEDTFVVDPATHGKIYKVKMLQSCCICGSIYEFDSQLNGPKQLVMVGAHFSCKFCRRHFVDEEKLLAHSLLHIDKSSFQCNVCLKSIATKNSLEVNFRSFTRDELSSPRDCKKSFSGVKSSNVLSSAAISTKLFLCNVCDESYTTETDLRKHIEYLHQNSQVERSEASTGNFQRIASIKLKELKIHLKRYTHDQLISRIDEMKYSKDLDNSSKESKVDCFPLHGTRNRDHSLKQSLSAPPRTFQVEKFPTLHASNETFISSQFIESQRRAPSHRKLPKCKICRKSFMKYNSLLNHVCANLTEESIIACEAHKACSGQKLVAKTRAKNVTKNEHFSCNFCTKSFTDKLRLQAHVKVHTRHRSFVCQMCGKIFNQEHHYLSHIHTHTDESSFLCHICGRKLKSKYNVEKHMRTHAKEEPFSCKVCEKRFKYASTLSCHELTHTSERPFRCELCGYGSRRKFYMSIHMRKHTGEKPFLCKVCSKKFSRKGAMEIHIRTHTGEKPFLCNVCGKKFSAKSTLGIHIRTHTGEKPFLCKVCGKKFSAKGTLGIHIRTHTGKKPFLCKVCGKEFSRKDALGIHIRTHTGEKPFLCKVCGMRSRSKSNWLNHMRKHTGEKPYVCEVCGKRFTRKTHLKRHVVRSKHIQDGQLSCEDCSKRFSKKYLLKKHIIEMHEYREVANEKQLLLLDDCDNAVDEQDAVPLCQITDGERSPEEDLRVDHQTSLKIEKHRPFNIYCATSNNETDLVRHPKSHADNKFSLSGIVKNESGQKKVLHQQFEARNSYPPVNEIEEKDLRHRAHPDEKTVMMCFTKTHTSVEDGGIIDIKYEQDSAVKEEMIGSLGI